MTHSPEIQQIDTVRAYYCGPRLIAEVDVVINKDERVEVAHDVAEALQIKLEKLPSVERAYVHIDYETSHKPVSAPNSGGDVQAFLENQTDSQQEHCLKKLT